MSMHLYKEIEKNIISLKLAIIDPEVALRLEPVVDYLQKKIEEQKEIRLNFICTHNSRRSIFSQVWAQTMASYFGIQNFTAYSGGTEATAAYPMVIHALRQDGFKIKQLSEGANPVYSIKFSEVEHPVIAFSKKHDHEFNPTSGFAAILTCSQANESCPFIAGADKRFPVTFEDPKYADGTSSEEQVYQAKSREIAASLFYIFSQLHKK